jgi:hypothetical protein
LVGDSGYTDNSLFDIKPETAEYRLRFYDSTTYTWCTVINWTSISGSWFETDDNEILLSWTGSGLDIIINSNTQTTYSDYSDLTSSNMYLWAAEGIVNIKNISFNGSGFDDDQPGRSGGSADRTFNPVSTR